MSPHSIIHPPPHLSLPFDRHISNFCGCSLNLLFQCCWVCFGFLAIPLSLFKMSIEITLQHHGLMHWTSILISTYIYIYTHSTWFWVAQTLIYREIRRSNKLKDRGLTENPTEKVVFGELTCWSVSLLQKSGWQPGTVSKQEGDQNSGTQGPLQATLYKQKSWLPESSMTKLHCGSVYHSHWAPMISVFKSWILTFYLHHWLRPMAAVSSAFQVFEALQCAFKSNPRPNQILQKGPW